MQSTGQTATHPVSRQSRQSRVMMYAMPSPCGEGNRVGPSARSEPLQPFRFFLTSLTRPGKEAPSYGDRRLLAWGSRGGGDDQLADRGKRGLGARHGRAGDALAVPPARPALRSARAEPDAGGPGPRLPRGPDELPRAAQPPRGARHPELRELLLSPAPRLPAARVPSRADGRGGLPAHRRITGRPRRPQPRGTDRALSHRDGRQPRPPGRDARRPVLRDAHPAARAGGVWRVRPLHRPAPSDLRTAWAHRPRGRLRALESAVPPGGTGGGRAVPELPARPRITAEAAARPPGQLSLPRPDDAAARARCRDRAGAAPRRQRPADGLAERHQDRIETPPLARRQRGAQRHLRRRRGTRRDVAPAVRDAVDVGIDADPGEAEGLGDYQVGRLPPYAGQGEERVEVGRHATSVAVEQRAGQGAEGSRLRAIESDRVDGAFDRPRRAPEERCWRPRQPEEPPARRPRRLVSRAQ